jgi:hypothetical protein
MRTVKAKDDTGREVRSANKIAARIVIHHGADMSAHGRRKIVSWMRREAAFLERHADQMATTYTARWMYM